MPVYDYRCTACGDRFEVMHGVHAAGPESCPACGAGPVVKALVAPAIVFKGSGWAKVDRRASSSAKGGGNAGKGSGDKANDAADGDTTAAGGSAKHGEGDAGAGSGSGSASTAGTSGGD